MITPGHPVKVQNNWVYPKELTQRMNISCDYFYNLVVDQDHIAIINDVEVILLGHDYTDGILKHDYLGSQKVISDLMKLPGFENGLINLQ